jgi:hypothetical protein
MHKRTIEFDVLLDSPVSAEGFSLVYAEGLVRVRGLSLSARAMRWSTKRWWKSSASSEANGSQSTC